jgi:fibronectin type 3 domain-containing protein
VGISQKEATIMTFRKHVMISIVLLSISGLLLGCSDDSTVIPKATLEAPPAAPSGLSVQINADGNVELAWDASTQPNIRGYNVYRHVASQSAIATLNDAPLAEARYIDDQIDRGRLYEYMVTSVTTRGTESAYSTIQINTTIRYKGRDREGL